MAVVIMVPARTAPATEVLATTVGRDAGRNFMRVITRERVMVALLRGVLVALRRVLVALRGVLALRGRLVALRGVLVAPAVLRFAVARVAGRVTALVVTARPPVR
jgi:hypothetical protein